MKNQLLIIFLSTFFLSNLNAQSSLTERIYIANQMANSTDPYETISKRAKTYFTQLTEETETSEDKMLEEQFEQWNYYWRNHAYYFGVQLGGNVEGAKAVIQNVLTNYQGCSNNANSNNAWQSEGPFQNSSGFCNVGIILSVETQTSNPNVIYAGGKTGLFKTIDGGLTWINKTDQLNQDLTIWDIALDQNNPNRLVISAGVGYANPVSGVMNSGKQILYESIDGGNTWYQGVLLNANLATSSEYFGRGIKFHNGHIFVGWGNQILKRPNDGNLSIQNSSSAWLAMNINVNINQIQSISSACATSTTANRFVSNIEGSLTNPNVLWAGVSTYPDYNNSPLLRSTDGGLNWSQLSLPIGIVSRNLISVDVTPADPGSVYIFLENVDLNTCSPYNNSYVLLKSTNDGTNWSILNSTICSPTIFPTFDGSGNWWWQASPGFEMSNLNANQFVIGGAVLMHGTLGSGNSCNYVEMTKYYSETAGLNSSPYTHADVRDNIEIYTIGNTEYMTLACDGGVIRSTNLGQSWQCLNGNGIQVSQFYSITSFNQNNNLLCTFMHDGPKLGSGSSWSSIISGGNFSHCEYGWTSEASLIDEKVIYHTEGSGALVSFDGGLNNYGLINSVYHSGQIHLSPYDQLSIFCADDNSSAIMQYSADASNVTSNGCSNYNSTLVQMNSNLSPVGAFAVAPTNSNVLIKDHIGTANLSSTPQSKVFITSNLQSSFPTWVDLSPNFTLANQYGGTTYLRHHADISNFVFDPLNENRIFASFNISGWNNAGSVFKTEDKGQTWTDITNGLPSVPINHLVYQTGSNDVLYAATELGVFRYNKAGSIWECFNQGLPAVNVTKIDINYCRKKIYISTNGRGAYSCNLPQVPDLHITTSLVNMINHTSLSSPTLNIPSNFYGQFANDIVVDAGVYVNQNGSMFFNPNHSFIVNKGSHVVLTGTMTTACPQLWKGIQVNGDANSNQNYSGGFAANQGIIEVLNGGTVKNALIGIRNYTYQTNGNPDFGSTGGVITGNKANFLNNATDIDLIDYNISNKTRFISTNFETNKMLLGNYSIGDHVRMKQLMDVGFYNCSFQYNANGLYPIGQRGIGIHAYNTKFIVEGLCVNSSTCTSSLKSKFFNLEYGIIADNTNPLQTNTVRDCEFSNISQVATFEKNVNYATVRNNTYQIGGLFSTNTGLSGVYMANCKYYKIENNDFKYLTPLNGGPPSISNAGTYGVVVNSSYDGAHNIYRNSFNNLYRGVGAFYNNAAPSNAPSNNILGVKIRCNQFGNNNTNTNDIIVLGTNCSIDQNQGNYIPGVSTATNLVGNRYYAPSCNASNKWRFANNSPWCTHSNNLDAICRIDPQPLCSSNPQLQWSNINLYYNSNLQCLDNFTVATKIIHNSDITALKAKLSTSQQNLESGLDNGNTQALKNFLNSSAPLTAKTASVLSLSPFVSDEVLTVIFSNTGLSSSDILDLHNANKPICNAAWQLILNRNFTGTIQSTLDEQQLSSHMNERYNLISAFTNDHYNLIQAYGDKICNFLTDTLLPSRDTAIATIANLPDGVCQLIDERVHSQSNPITISEIDQLHNGSANIDDGCNFQKFLISLNSSSDNWFSLKNNNSLKSDIEAVANNENNSAKYLARAVLSYIFNNSYQVEYLDFENQGGRSSNAEAIQSTLGSVKEVTIENGNVIQIFPNPTNNFLNIILNSNEDNFYSFKLCNLIGAEMISGQIESAKMNQIDTKWFAKGLYMLKIYKNGNVISTQKIITID